MYFRQFNLESLGHASYLVADERTGQALVFDPRRDVDPYLAAAREKEFRIAYACDSHGHNDYLSGLGELHARVPELRPWGAATAELGYPHRPLRDGEMIEIGELGIEVLHTPGHTPEHISLLVYDRSSGEAPVLLLSGGALLVGDLARPDLLGSEEQTRAAAQEFCTTIQTKLLPLPDHVEVFPTHVAGSLCGASIGSRLSTTLGYERRTNPILASVPSAAETIEGAVQRDSEGDTESDGKEGFVRECLRLDNLPAVPPYWRRMRRQNLSGVAVLDTLTEPPGLSASEFHARCADDAAVVLDARSPEAFGGGHIPRSLNVGLGSAFPIWAGTVLDPDDDLLLVLDRPADLWEVTWHLLRIGYPQPSGWLAGGMTAWRTSARPIETIPQITVQELKPRLDAGELRVLDVRQPGEWSQGHIEGATFITGAELPARLGDVPDDKPVVTICGSGYRSSVAASLINRRSKVTVINVLGGMTAWNNAGYPTTT